MTYFGLSLDELTEVVLACEAIEIEDPRRAGHFIISPACGHP